MKMLLIEMLMFRKKNVSEPREISARHRYQNGRGLSPLLPARRRRSGPGSVPVLGAQPRLDHACEPPPTPAEL